MSEGIIVRTKLKEFAGDMSIASDFADALDARVSQLIEDAKRRAKENGRNTLMVRDI